jgi:hypothetical protein
LPLIGGANGALTMLKMAQEMLPRMGIDRRRSAAKQLEALIG